MAQAHDSIVEDGRKEGEEKQEGGGRWHRLHDPTREDDSQARYFQMAVIAKEL